MDSKYMFVLCGFPASGKSTIAKKISATLPCVVTSMDMFRTPTNDGGLDQSNNDVVFGKFIRSIQKAIRNDKNVVVDALNLKAKSRKQYMKLSAKKDYKNICIFIDCDIDTCMKNNFNKDRTHNVPLAYFEKIKKCGSRPTLNEGWDEVYIIKINYETNNITVVEHICNS